MIKTFADNDTRQLFETGECKAFPADIIKRAIRRLDQLDAAYVLDDMRVPPGNRFHALQGDRDGCYAVCINDRWRLCFRFAGEDAYDVEICDYHR